MLELPYGMEGMWGISGRRYNPKINHLKQCLLQAKAVGDDEKARKIMQKLRMCKSTGRNEIRDRDSFGPDDNLGITIIGCFQPLVF